MAFIGNTPTTQAFTPAIDYFSGNASTTAFTLSRPVASVAQVQVTIDNVAQNPSSAYTVSNNTITFTSAPLSGTNNIYVYYTSPITQVIAPGQGTVTATSMASSTGTGAGVFQTSPTITTPTIDTITSAASAALTLKSAGTTAVTVDSSQNVGIGTASPSAKLNVLDSVGGANGTVWLGSATYYGTIQHDAAVTGANIYTVATASGGGHIFKRGSTEQMRIDSSGRVTRPYQPAFCIFGDVYSGVTFLGQNVITNVGSNFSTSTGRFTAPVTGVYMLCFALTTADTNSQFIEITVNGSNVANRQLSYGVVYQSGTQFVIVNINVGDYATAQKRDASYGTYNGVFSGYLL